MTKRRLEGDHRPSAVPEVGADRTDRRQRPTRPRTAAGRTLIEALDRRELLTTFVVTSVADTGAGTLRQAILDANQAGGTNTIDFSISGTNTTIQPRSALPTITNPLIIDGTSQPGYTNAPLIVLDGKLAGSGATGLLITAGNCTVRGLVINHFDGTGLELENSGNNLVEGNYIGTDVTGTQAEPNGKASSWDPGLLIDNSAHNTVGGTSTGAGNLLSGNDADGLDIEGNGNGNLVEGNKIGTDVTGTVALANSFDGLWIGLGAGGDTIGGASAGAGNVISGNAGNGLEVDTTDGGGQGPGNLIQGNFIGTNAAGNAAIGNAIGVNIECTGNNTIGGTVSGAGNVISGNNSDGLWFYGTNCTQNLVQGNVIGSDPTGTVSLPNGGSAGILLTNNGDTSSVYATQNTIGGTAAGAANLIAFNAGDGVDVQGGQGNCILGNSFHANSGLGINLQQTPNPYTNGVLTPGDPNQGINVPVFSSVVWNGSSLSVSGYIGQPNTSGAGFGGDQVEVYVLDGTRAGAQSEGQTLVGRLNTNGQGAFSGTITASGLSANIAVTATATDAPGDTSQFAPAVVATNAGGLTATSTIVRASPAPSTYGQTVTFTATVNSLLGILLGATGTMSFYDGTTLLGTSTVSGGTATYTISSLSAGTHNITATYGGDSLDASSSSSPFAQVVNPAPLTITANSATIHYGQSLPTFTANFSGLVAGDTPANLSGSYSVQFGTSAPTGDPGGTYSITPSGFNDPNYTTTYVAGTLTITPVPLTVRVISNSTVYGQPDPLFTVVFTGLVNGDVPTDFPGLVLNSPATPTSPVGTYTVTPSGIVTTSYTITYVSGSLTIKPANLTVAMVSTSRAYGQANPTFSANFTGLTNGDTPANVGTVSYSTSANASSPVNSYPVTPGGLNDPNYTISYVPGTLSVTPAPVTVTVENVSKIYGQPNPTFTAAFSGLVNGDTPSTLGTLSVTTTATTSSSVGPYPISVSGLSDSNYAITYTPATLTITAAPLTVAVNNATIVYGQSNPSFTAVITGLVNGDTAASLGTLAFSSATAGSSAGTYPISASGLDDANYQITYVPATLTISPAPLTVAADDANSTYGQPDPAFTATFFGLVNGDTPGALGALTFSTTATESSNVGTYSIAVSGLIDANYSISYLPATLTVNPASLTVAAADASKTYGQPNPTFTDTFTGLVNGDTPASLGPLTLSTTADSSSDVGTYPISAADLVAPNYLITYLSAALTVAPAALTVDAVDANKTYGQPNPTFADTFSGVVNGDTPANFGTPSFNTTADQSSGAGTYPISVSGLADSNYTITYLPATLTVTPAALAVAADNASKTYGQPNPTFSATFTGLVNGDTAADIGTPAFSTDATQSSNVGIYTVSVSGLTSQNYTITYFPSALTIFAATLTVAAADAGKTYGQPNPTFTDTFSGLVNGDTPASLGTPTFSTTADQSSGAGTYPISLSGLANSNYAITYLPATLTVTPAALTVAVDNANKTYGQANPTFTATFAGLVNGDTPGSLGALTFSTTASASSNVGTYPISVSGLTASNYLISYVPATLTVGQAALTVAANDASKVYGQANPAFTATFTGLVNGDTAADVGTPTFSTAATQGSGVGTYPISVSGVASGNYTITYLTATLSVTPATLAVAADNANKVYGQPNPAFTATIAGLVNGDTAANLGTLTFNTTATASSSVGDYPVLPAGLNDPNYDITYQSAALDVTPAPLTVTAQDATRPYGQADPPFQATIAGLVNGDTLADLGTVSFQTTANASSAVGSYAITPYGLTAPNYTVTYVAGVLQVTNFTAIVASASVNTANYGQSIELSAVVTNALGPSNPPTGTVSFYDGPTLLGSSTLSDGTASLSTSSLPIGSNVITATYSGDSANGFASSDPFNVNVVPAPLAVQVASTARRYGQTNPDFSATFTGLANGDSPGVLGSLSFSTDAGASSAVGTYAVSASGLNDPNYAISYVSGTLTINPAPLSVTVDDATRTYGQPNPGFSATYSGLVNGDSPDSVGTLSIETTADQNSPVGAYPLTASGLNDPNYDVSYDTGMLTVTPAPVTVAAADATRLYGQPNPAFDATFQGLVNGDRPSDLGTLSFQTPAQPTSDVGSDPITPFGLSDPNYAITYEPAVLTIDPAPLTVTANDTVKVAGAGNPSFTATIAGLAAGDSAAELGTISFLTAADAASSAGTYAITPYGLSDPNYRIDFEPGTLTVNTRVLGVTAQTISTTVNTPFQDVVASFTDNLPAPADEYIAQVTWGDGQVSTETVEYDSAQQRFDISGTHTYTSAGLYTVGVEVESGSVEANATGTATVVSASLQISPLNVAATAGAPFSGVVATFSDSALAIGPSAYTATVYWGDGQTSAGTIDVGPAGRLTVTGSNTYASEGVFAVRVVVIAHDGREGQASGLAAVAAAPVTIVGVPLSTSAATPFEGVVAQFDVASDSDSATDFDATIDWGDGITSVGTIIQIGPGQFTVAGSHTYAVAGSLSAQVIVTSALTLRATADLPATIVSAATGGPIPSPVESTTPPSNVSAGSVTSSTPPSVTAYRTPAAPPPIAVALIVGNNALGGGPMTGSNGTTTSASPSLSPPHAIAPAHAEVDSEGNANAAVAAAVPAVSSNAAAPVAHPAAPAAASGAGNAGAVDIHVALPEAAAATQASLAPPEQLWDALDRLDEQVAAEPPLADLANVVGVGTVAYVGYVLLHTRGGYLLLSLLSAHPLWREMDPLAVLLNWEKEQERRRKARGDQGDEDESLQSIIEGDNAREKDDDGHDAHQPRSVQYYHQHLIRRKRARGSARPRGQRAQNPKDAV